MSTQSTLSLSSSVLSGQQRTVSQGRVSIAGLSLTGLLLFLIGVLVMASGYSVLRPRVFGLALHASLLPIGVAFPLVVMSRLGQFPIRILVALLAFIGIYSFSVFNGTNVALNEIFKINAALVSILTTALLVRKRGDFVAGALGLSIAIALLAARGLQAEATVRGIDVIEGANKNTYSMFALPAILLAGFIYLHMPTVPRLVKMALIACSVLSLLIIFMSANRSGYVGAALVGLMLFWDRRGRGLLLVALAAAVVAGWLVYSGSTAAFDRRIKQTVEGNTSDDVRVVFLWNAARVALENPIIGVSPQQLPFHLGRISRADGGRFRTTAAAHNVFAHVAAGSGLICFAALLFLGWTLWNPTPRDPRRVQAKDDPVRNVRRLLRMMVILWVVRGMFTSEIHFNPTFNIAFGLIIGLYVLVERERDLLRADERSAAPQRNPALASPA